MLPPSPASPTAGFGATRRRALVVLCFAAVLPAILSAQATVRLNPDSRSGDATPPAALPAQAPADFSGRWMLDAPAVASTPAVPGTPAAAAAPGDMGSGWGATITVAQDASRLTVEYAVFSRYDLQPPLTFTYPLDGSVGRNTVVMGRGEQIESSRAQWNGQALIIITTFDVAERGAGKPFTAEITRKLWLESPATLVVEVTRAGVLGGPASTTRSVYRKG